MTSGNKIALLIDGDNADSKIIEQYISESNRYGRVTVKRIYGDWTDNHMKSWKDVINSFAIRPIQKFAYTKAKNSTDTALIIDAMDLLHSKLVDGFCIVSSDSDYTGLAHRIREEGLFIMGIGKSHTPESFIKACENFIYEEILHPVDIIDRTKTEQTKKSTEKEKEEIFTGPKAPKLPGIKILGKINLVGSLKNSGVKPIDYSQIEAAFQMVVDIDTGLALLSRFSEALRKIDSTFDHRNFGYVSFRKFCEALSPQYETVFHEDGQTISLKKKDEK